MRTLLIAAILSLLCMWPESSLASRGHAVTGEDPGLARSAEEESAEEGRNDEANPSPEAEAATEAEAEAAEEEAAATEEREGGGGGEEEEEHQTGDMSGSRSGHHSGRYATRTNHVAVVSQLDLTARAESALRHKAPATHGVAFSFTLNHSAKLQVTLVKRTFSHGRVHWTPMPGSIVLGAHKGRGAGNLSGHRQLSPGRYRLTVKPTGGRPRSIYLTAHAHG